MKISLPNITDNAGQLNSVYPCTDYLTFNYWIYLVPQYKPESVLMLGYAGGTVAGLIRKLYGDVPITGVDLERCPNYYDVNLVETDARKFIKVSPHFDTVIVDLFEDGSYEVPSYITKKVFADDIKKIANYLIFHVREETDMSVYKDLNLVRTLSLNGSKFYYFMFNDIPSLHV